MNKVAFSRHLAGLASTALLALLFCPFVAEASSGSDAAVDTDVAPIGRCHTDADCVPASCCHPTSCVPRHQGPRCGGIFCTLECRPGTMDCGQGHCACQWGRCVAVISDVE